MGDGGKLGKGDPAPSAIAGETPTTDGGALKIRLLDLPRPIDAGPDATLQRGAPTRESAQAPRTVATLTNFDWLDTIVDELLLVSAHPTQPTPLPAAEPGSGIQAPAATDRLDSQAVLSHIVLGYSPMIDRRHGVVATRLTAIPLRPEQVIDAAKLLDALAEVWPPGGATVSLNVASERLLQDLLSAEPAANVMIEVPAFMASDPSHTRALLQLAARGNTLLLKGRPTSELPRAVLPCFKWSIVDFADDRRRATPDPSPKIVRTIAHIQAGVRTMAEVRSSFDAGAVAVIGWPLHEPIASFFEVRPDLHAVLDMLGRIDKGGSGHGDPTLVSDPVLALELLRHVNATSSGLYVETGSFGHAMSILGPESLRRWLAGTLARTGDDVRLRPANFAALRRGLLMRELAPAGSDAEMRGELFMCGVFSLLDRIFSRPIGELLSNVAIPERVMAALTRGNGPFHPLLELARAVETERPTEIRAAADAVFLAPLEINRALLRSLLYASAIERAERGESPGPGV